jgi:hypothetical protein
MKADTCSNPYRTPFQWCPKTVRHQPGSLSDRNRNGVRQDRNPVRQKLESVSDSARNTHEGAGVHSAYESNMIDRHAPELFASIRVETDKMNPYPNINSGFDAALATVRLMDRSANAIPPTKLADAFIDAGATKTVGVYDELWDQFGKETSKVMADGAHIVAN